MAYSSAVDGWTTGPSTTTNRLIDKLFINWETFDIWSNTQTFSISWNTDKENAKLALDYYMAGNTPILRYNNKLYFLNAIWPGTTDANRYLFFVCPENSTTSNVHNFIYLYYYTDETVRSLSIWNNTAYFVRWNYTASVVSALPSSPGSTTLYFITA